MKGFHPPVHEPPERVSLTCPLGLRFVDAATKSFVSDGLEVAALPAGAPARQASVTPVLTAGGVFAFHGLPGLRAFENSEAEEPWSAALPSREFRIQVTDPSGRFLPCAFSVTAPAKFSHNSSSPPLDTGAIPLFSSPARHAPPGLAAVRAQLRSLETGSPAALAMVEAEYSTGGELRTARGLADGRGGVVLFFPWPEGQRAVFNSSPHSSAPGPSRQEWTLRLLFFHAPSSTAAESPPGAPKTAPHFVDYASHLHQPAARAWRSDSPVAPVEEATLQSGRELNLGTLDLETL